MAWVGQPWAARMIFSSGAAVASMTTATPSSSRSNTPGAQNEQLPEPMQASRSMEISRPTYQLTREGDVLGGHLGGRGGLLGQRDQAGLGRGTDDVVGSERSLLDRERGGDLAAGVGDHRRAGLDPAQVAVAGHGVVPLVGALGH